mmetsp:Transcript_6294/g.13192  ORF Transcript_6294/g.13192 Transcript_6294/m.13192 type:complete len:318 (+) Transcript_6294:965-1918(+)
MRSSQGANIFSPTFPRHQRTSKLSWWRSTKKYAIPSAAAALHCDPGAKSPVRIIGSKISSYVLLLTPSRTHRSRKDTPSYRRHASSESSNSLKARTSGRAVARSSGPSFSKRVNSACPIPVGSCGPASQYTGHVPSRPRGLHWPCSAYPVSGSSSSSSASSSRKILRYSAQNPCWPASAGRPPLVRAESDTSPPGRGRASTTVTRTLSRAPAEERACAHERPPQPDPMISTSRGAGADPSPAGAEKREVAGGRGGCRRPCTRAGADQYPSADGGRTERTAAARIATHVGREGWRNIATKSQSQILPQNRQESLTARE